MTSYNQNNGLNGQKGASYLSPYESAYKRGRMSLLVVIIFTLINFALMFVSGRYFVFSAYVPYYIVLFGGLLSGLLPAEYYGYYASGDEGEALGAPALIAALILACLILLLYFICWLLSKKRVGWLITALVLFSLDTLFVLYTAIASGALIGSLFDLVFHGLFIFELVAAVLAWKKIKNKPDEPVIETEYSEIEAEYNETKNDQNKD